MSEQDVSKCIKFPGENSVPEVSRKPFVITNDMTFEILPHVVEIFEKLDIAGFVKKNKVIVKDKKELEKVSEQKAMDFVIFLAKNAPKVKTEIFSIVAIIQGKTVEEIASGNLFDTFKAFQTLLSNKDLMVFFQQFMK